MLPAALPAAGADAAALDGAGELAPRPATAPGSLRASLPSASALRGSRAGPLLPKGVAAAAGCLAATLPAGLGVGASGGPPLLPNDKKEERCARLPRKPPGQLEERREGAPLGRVCLPRGHSHRGRGLGA